MANLVDIHDDLSTDVSQAAAGFCVCGPLGFPGKNNEAFPPPRSELAPAFYHCSPLGYSLMLALCEERGTITRTTHVVILHKLNSCECTEIASCWT